MLGSRRGASSIPRLFEGEGFASIPAKIWGGDSPTTIGWDGPEMRHIYIFLLTITYYCFLHLNQTASGKVATFQRLSFNNASLTLDSE